MLRKVIFGSVYTVGLLLSGVTGYQFGHHYATPPAPIPAPIPPQPEPAPTPPAPVVKVVDVKAVLLENPDERTIGQVNVDLWAVNSLKKDGKSRFTRYDARDPKLPDVYKDYLKNQPKLPLLIVFEKHEDGTWHEASVGPEPVKVDDFKKLWLDKGGTL
jgi:hypothetical protein